MKAHVLTAPEDFVQSQHVMKKTLFMAGTITGTSDWQSKMIKLLANQERLVIFNPRRANFDVTNPKESEKQIKWEYDYLAQAMIISFWFAKETVAPITLFELGKHLNNTKKMILIGIDPEYPRKFDVEYQVKLARPTIPIVNSVEKLSELVKALVPNSEA